MKQDQHRYEERIAEIQSRAQRQATKEPAKLVEPEPPGKQFYHLIWLIIQLTLLLSYFHLYTFVYFLICFCVLAEETTETEGEWFVSCGIEV